MLRMILNQVPEARYGEVEESQQARIRKRNHAGPDRESEGLIVPCAARCFESPGLSRRVSFLLYHVGKSFGYPQLQV